MEDVELLAVHVDRNGRRHRRRRRSRPLQRQPGRAGRRVAADRLCRAPRPCENHFSLKFRAPTNVILRRAQLTLILAALLPTILTTPVGIVILVMHSSAAVTVVGGLLVLAFCTSSLTGYILASIFLSRGASLAKVQQDFLSSVSHELTTPITSVRLFIDTLKSDRVTDPAERAKCLDIIDREMARLDGLVGKLIALSKIEAGR